MKVSILEYHITKTTDFPDLNQCLSESAEKVTLNLFADDTTMLG